ncbi:MAG: translation initiation factor IF-2 [Candidatus Curtissbacteria bacterium]|nr:translation initiation factor IF-2 [Candidatus Curtissbacteria bacterium]
MQKDNTSLTRPPIVTIMGHVDHGKTTLLDAIRKTNVVAREHGGITQHIGAYKIEFEGKPITFIDTPGHAAFEKMRSRGALAADIVVLTVAANDGVKPQTVEAIKHIKSADKPIIVAITKVDLPNVNVEKAKKELQTQEVTVEGYGGDVPVVEVAAPKAQGINELLELILLVWDLNPQPFLPSEPLEAFVVESFMDKRRGPIVTVIVNRGTLKIGQKIIVDSDTITVKALVDDGGKNLKEALPGDPVEILGFKKTLEVGSIVKDQIVAAIQEELSPVSFADIIAKAQDAKSKFKLIIKADVRGSLEAILENLPKTILVLSSATGDVSEKDIDFAKTAGAPIITFNIKTPSSVISKAERDGVLIKSYDVIYKLLEDMEGVAEGFEQAKVQSKVVGRGTIIASFVIEGKKIAGTKVTKGKFTVGDQVALMRNENQVATAKIATIKKFKKDFPSVLAGQECGIAFSGELDFQEGDTLESFGP